MPSTGIDRRTGKVLTGLDHVYQSLEVIFTTPIGSRVMRRTFGSFVPDLLGRNLSPQRLVAFETAIILAIELWEPRLRVKRIIYPRPQNNPDGARAGKLGMTIRAEYRPNALQGDFTSDVETIDL